MFKMLIYIVTFCQFSFSTFKMMFFNSLQYFLNIIPYLFTFVSGHNSGGMSPKV